MTSGHSGKSGQNGPGPVPSLPAQVLAGVLAKSAGHSGTGKPELLTQHSAATYAAARDIAERIGPAGILAGYPEFWTWAEWATLLHDAGKIADGFQLQLRRRGHAWGERHEVLSLAYVDLLTSGLPGRERAMIAAGVVFHHRCLGGEKGLSAWYPPEAQWDKKFGADPDAIPPRPKSQVTAESHAALLAWLSARLGVQVPAASGDLEPWERARDLFATVEDRWEGPLDEEDGLIAVLLQGAVTLADRSASAGVRLDRQCPVPFGYLEGMEGPYPHQVAAGETDGHLILIAATGSGKTKGGLAWASHQMEGMPGLPRLAWLLPYRASIDAIRDGLAEEFGCGLDGIGVLHATTAATLLSRATCDDQAAGPQDARKARALAGAMRLFQQRVRVATPHQLLRAAIAGPKYSSVLLEQANSVIVLDELHAYDPVTFGWICAAMSLWERLGSRVAVLSATLAPPMIDLVRDSLSQPVTVQRAPAGIAPLRHRLVLDVEPVTAPGSLGRIQDWLAEGHSVLVVANTVARAQRVFRELSAGTGGDDAMLLHSRFKLGDRAAIERRILRRHPERQPGDPARRGGGLTVSTQALEVSLCLDFDRGASELAPVEAIAQRAGRVNRRGRHPGGAVEFRVHAVESSRPYEDGAIEAALLALRAWDGRLLSEEAIGDWLDRAYATPWGKNWATAARESRDDFAQAFLRFTDPFGDRSEFARGLDERLDTVEVLLHSDRDEYKEQVSGGHGDPMLAAQLLIPVSIRQVAMLGGQFDKELDTWVVDAPYHPRTGLDIAPRPRAEPETIL
jgi:CRISPR-associated endonuclease/helicase Cas3